MANSEDAGQIASRERQDRDRHIVTSGIGGDLAALVDCDANVVAMRAEDLRFAENPDFLPAPSHRGFGVEDAQLAVGNGHASSRYSASQRAVAALRSNCRASANAA